MKWRYTNIQHGPRLQIGVSPNEYCVLDLYYQSQTNPKYSVDGYAQNSYAEIGGFLGFNKATVFKMVDRFVAAGLMEVDPANPSLKRTTEAWYGVAYEDLAVEKVNATVEKVNASRLKIQRHIKEEIKEEKKRNTTPLTPQGERSEDFDVTGTDAPKQQNETETPTPPSPPAPAAPQTLDEKAAWLLNYWNKNVRRDKRALTASIYLKGMKARLKEGASGQDCVNVIKDRVLAWYHDDQMNKNVDPVTLFRKANFSRYLDSWHDRTEAERRKVSDITKFIANPPKPGQAQAVAPRPVGKTSADQIAC
jgi:uncharacterized phage protein (TIGR02220 family)